MKWEGGREGGREGGGEKGKGGRERVSGRERPLTHLVNSLEIVLEVRHEMILSVGSYTDPHPTQVSPGVTGHQGVSYPPRHAREADEGLRVLSVCQEAVALQDGRFYIAGKG